MSLAHADDPLGLYIGAAYGQAHIKAQLAGLVSGAALPGLDSTRSAYQAMLGLRPLSFLGAEVTYVDLGQASLAGLNIPAAGAVGTVFTAERASQKGEAAYALLYLPVPVIDVYLKAGMSRITTDKSATYFDLAEFCQIGHPNCNVHDVSGSSTDTAFAYGAGLEWKLGDWAVRGEYERFSAAGANPSLFSIGMTYWPSY
jgi:opacity protein-like surface antigen